MSKQLYLVSEGKVSAVDVSDLAWLEESESYMRERVCAYTETEEQALYCAKLYDHNLLHPNNTVIDGETHKVLTLPRISVRTFEDRPDYDDVIGTLYVDRRDGDAWIDYQREVYVGHSQAQADKRVLTCKLPVDCTVTELECMLHALRNLIVSAALSPDRETAIERERTLRECAKYFRNELGER
jgi:hypothetical protein